jgi:hypothetical protein
VIDSKLLEPGRAAIQLRSVFSRLNALLPLAALALFGAAVSLKAQNLLLNPGFESGISSPASWSSGSSGGPSPAGVTFTWESSLAQAGVRAVSIDSTGACIKMNQRELDRVGRRGGGRLIHCDGDGCHASKHHSRPIQLECPATYPGVTALIRHLTRSFRRLFCQAVFPVKP